MQLKLETQKPLRFPKSQTKKPVQRHDRARTADRSSSSYKPLPLPKTQDPSTQARFQDDLALAVYASMSPLLESQVNRSKEGANWKTLQKSKDDYLWFHSAHTREKVRTIWTHHHRKA